MYAHLGQYQLCLSHLLLLALEVQQLEAAQLWHIEDILLQHFLDLQARFPSAHGPPPSVLPIPLHKTEQYPLPVMHIDGSSLDGTIEVLNAIIWQTLHMSEDNVCKHNIFLHQHPDVTIPHCLIILWKPISAGWKAKKLPPFHPTFKLINHLILSANILDAFWLLCPANSVKTWIADVSSWDDVYALACRCVLLLHSLPDVKRNKPLENIGLFNQDALLLCKFVHAIKHGDIGSILNILSMWKLMLHGTRSMSKYSDALFHLLVTLWQMDLPLRHAFLMNWLINLSGHKNG
ncbi:hypothetical protein OBBRIDRAFT_805747 [Obba rivulosa]|uniref:DUF6589 domain-containing protein n=1 Tax=Obba rivulosa TaxID=1052685 RepID=A0A8E2ANF5_9APHY|nr:hypothetical protein OBBRIDRAFT_805747 [Obba rivulosa]